MLSRNLECLCGRQCRECNCASDLLLVRFPSARSFEDHAIYGFFEDFGVDEPATIVVSCEHRGGRKVLEKGAKVVVFEFCECDCD